MWRVLHTEMLISRTDADERRLSTFLQKEVGQMQGGSFVLEDDVTTLVVAIPVMNPV